MTRPLACGIDFGTSNSTVSVSGDAGNNLISLEEGKTTLPSAIFFAQGMAPQYGRQAISSYLDGEDGRLMRGLKKILGTSLMNDKTIIAGKAVSFTDIIKTFISHLKNKADHFAGQSIENVVLGRPVHFHDDDESADNAAQETLAAIAKDAGFCNIEFLYEPLAAAFAHESRIEEEKLSLVVDLGGGTSDFSVIKICRQNLFKTDRKDDILSTAGVRIGGTSFDGQLSLKCFMPSLGLGSQYHDLFDKKKLMPVPSGVYRDLSDWAFVNMAQSKKAVNETLDIKRRASQEDKIGRLLYVQQNHLGHALLGEVEKTKIALTDEHTHIAGLKELGPDFKVDVTREIFEEAIKTDVQRIEQTIHECLLRARVSKEKIEIIVLTGGSTELPVINRMIENLFPHALISQGNKLDSVGLGLAYRAANIF
ncbi:MAG: hsp70 family protein [Micavibrio aeruginosavorus]|uniref:Hsp70 family protein n=1 Tax=Micavibrio aeruginosavorus TaxID=349221 RepID=A0A2W5N4A9_9BACT|nr:MAG: hsp70 family protein [Micavibrio aeruginosavorus]